MASNLIGTETVEIGTVSANGQPNPFRLTTTTQAIADLSSQNTSCYATTTTNYISSTALTVPLGMTTGTILPGVYEVDGYIQGVAPAACGIQVELVGTAGLVVGFCNITGWNFNGTTTNAVTNSTALSTDLANSAAAYTTILMAGTFQVLTAGQIMVETAQHTSSTATTTVVTGSYLNLNLV